MTTTELGLNDAHYAAYIGDTDYLFAILKESPELTDATSIYGTNIAHYAAGGGNTKCLLAILEKFRYLTYSTSEHDENIAHYAALSGNAKCLFAVLNNFPKLKYTITEFDENIACFAAESNKDDCLVSVLLCYPEFIPTLTKTSVELDTTLDIKSIVAEVKAILAAQSVEARKSPHHETTMFKRQINIHELYVSTTLDIANKNLSEKTKNKFRELIRRELERHPDPEIEPKKLRVKHHTLFSRSPVRHRHHVKKSHQAVHKRCS